MFMEVMNLLVTIIISITSLLRNEFVLATYMCHLHLFLTILRDKYNYHLHKLLEKKYVCLPQ